VQKTSFGAANAVQCCSQEMNVGQTERLVSAIAGGALLLNAANLRSIRGVIATVIGAGLICRAASGHCQLYEATGINTREEGTVPRQASQSTRNVVDLGSEDSMPASDPPSWTGASAS
jgi:uncharacterized membrane protein